MHREPITNYCLINALQSIGTGIDGKTPPYYAWQPRSIRSVRIVPWRPHEVFLYTAEFHTWQLGHWASRITLGAHRSYTRWTELSTLTNQTTCSKTHFRADSYPFFTVLEVNHCKSGTKRWVHYDLSRIRSFWIGTRVVFERCKQERGVTYTRPTTFSLNICETEV